MLKHIIGTAFALFLVLGAPFTSAEEAAPGYEAVEPAQPTANPNKIEVIEFFWYGCPHCYSFEPTLNAWLKTKPENVEFVRIPAVFSDEWAKGAKAYYIAEALGVIDAVHSDLFDAVQQKNQKLDSEEELLKFFAAHGVKEADFKDAYNSFMVDTKLRQAPAVSAKYGLTGVPTLIVNGKYRTTGTLAGGSQDKMIDIVNDLIKKESGGK